MNSVCHVLTVLLCMASLDLLPRAPHPRVPDHIASCTQLSNAHLPHWLMNRASTTRHRVLHQHISRVSTFPHARSLQSRCSI